MMRRYRGLVLLLAAVAIIAIAVAIVLRPKPVQAEIGGVDRGAIESSVEAEAKTRVREPFVVSAPLAGRVFRIAVREGDRVARGAIVAKIDPLPSTESVRQALAQIEEMRAQITGVETLRAKPETIAQARARAAAAAAAYAQAKRDRIRAQSLAESGDIPRAQLEAALLAERSRALELDAARAAVTETQSKRTDPEYLIGVYRSRIAAIQTQLRTLEDQASRTTVMAPVSGTVLRVVQRSEQTVAAGTPLIEIGDVSNLEIVADVLSQDAVDIRAGNPIVIERGAGTAQRFGKVLRVEPSAHTKVSALGVEEQRVNVIGLFDTVPAGVRDQYRLDVRIVTWRARALRVPAAALFRCAQEWCVFKVVDGKARRSSVSLGRRTADYAQVLRGLAEGDRVVLHPSDDVSDGTALSIRFPESRKADHAE